MAKKKKVRVDLRKNRSKPPRPKQWTRGFHEHGFEEEFFLAEPDSFGVGVHRFTGEPQPLDPAVKLFTFVR